MIVLRIKYVKSKMQSKKIHLSWNRAEGGICMIKEFTAYFSGRELFIRKCDKVYWFF